MSECESYIPLWLAWNFNSGAVSACLMSSQHVAEMDDVRGGGKGIGSDNLGDSFTYASTLASSDDTVEDTEDDEELMPPLPPLQESPFRKSPGNYTYLIAS